MLRLLVQQLGIGGVLVLGVAAHGVLEERNALRRPGVRLAAEAEGILAADFKRVAQDGGVAEGVGVPALGLFGDRREIRAADARGGAGEELVDKALVEADRVENLRAAIGLIGRDAHLRHHLEDALVDGLDVALHRVVGADLLRQVLSHRLQSLEGEVRVDRFGAIARQTAEMVDFARVAGLDHEADGGAQALADEVVMHRRGREQSRDRDAVGPGHPVGQHDDVVAAGDGGLRTLAQPLKRLFHPRRALLGGIGDVERLGVERILEMADRANLFEIAIGQDRLAHLKPLTLGAAVVEQIGARPDERDEAHHQFFANRVDRRVGDLREVLLEIGVERLRLRGQRRDRRVGAHRADGFLAGGRHRRHQDRKILLRIAERLLLIEQRDVRCAGPAARPD